MGDDRAVLVGVDDAHLLAWALAKTGAHRGALRDEGGEATSARLGVLYDRLLRERGVAPDRVAAALRRLDVIRAAHDYITAGGRDRWADGERERGRMFRELYPGVWNEVTGGGRLTLGEAWGAAFDDLDRALVAEQEAGRG